MDEKNFVANFFDTLKKNSFAVKKILFNMDDSVSAEEFNALDKKFRELQQTNLRLETDLNNRLNEIENLQRRNADLNEKVQNLSGRLKTFEENYSELEAAYNSYLQLPDAMQFALEGVFGKKNSPVSFLAGALQEGHLESLFDFAAQAVNQGKPQAEIEILSELLDFVFSAVNSGRREKIYRRLDMQIGDDFDRETMRKIPASRQSGTVREIFLRGFKYATSGKIIRQSLISLA